MKTLKYKFTLESFFLLLTVLFALNAAAQTAGPPQTLAEKLDGGNEQFPREKVHLHLDKPYYTIGDTIWLKAYVVNAENKLSALSRIVYVDLINDRDSVKRTLRLPLNAGLAWGDFTLTDTLNEGNYRIRAYTAWMRNFGEEHFFDKTIPVGNSLSNSVVTNATYSYTKTGNTENVTALINFARLDGIRLTARDVNYEVFLNSKTAAKGKGATDSRGNLSVTFSNDKGAGQTTGMIVTNLKLDNKQVVVKNIPVKATSSSADVQFFPESGKLVENILSKVAFKAVGVDGLGVGISGQLIDKDTKKVADFKAEHAGMGTFEFRPEPGNSYKAVVQFADGSEKNFNLPAAAPKGYVIRLDNSGKDSIKVRISVSPQVLQEGGEVALIARANNGISYASKTKLQALVLNANLAKSRFPAGIVQFTLYDKDLQPVAERLAFIQKDDRLSIAVSTDKPGYSKRERVKMDLDLKDPSGTPAIGSFSVAVTDISKAPADENTETSILSNLLLSSDLKGHIENPNYYFTEPLNIAAALTTEKTRQLDNLLLTQGWRNFIPKGISPAAKEESPGALLQFQPEQAISISGRVLSGGKPEARSKVTLFASGNGLLLDTLTDKDGKFNFDNLEFADSTKLVIQARNAKDRRNVVIELDRLPTPLVSKNINNAAVQINVNASMLPYLKSSRETFDELKKYGLVKSAVELKEVTISAKRIVNENSSNLNGPGNADQVLDEKVLLGQVFVADALQGRVAGLTVSNGIASMLRNMGRPMTVIVDGMIRPEGDARCLPFCSALNSVNPFDVETIEILKTGGKTAVYGSEGSGGVIIITTKRGPSKFVPSEVYAPGIVTFIPKGYQPVRQFYSPVYDPKTPSRMTDLRTTIYWNPHIVPDADGKAKLEFFTADTPGTYRAVVEGLDVTGKLGRKVYTFTVDK